VRACVCVRVRARALPQVMDEVVEAVDEEHADILLERWERQRDSDRDKGQTQTQRQTQGQTRETSIPKPQLS
jgi:uncharacterized protein YmfQ (DUF2313 family)